MRCRRKWDPLKILEAIFYLLRTGCQWRLLPGCYHHWKSVYNKWRYWSAKGLFEKIVDCVSRRWRIESHCTQNPTLCFIDSASRRSGLSFSAKGVDGFKKIKGIKLHPAVDTNGFMLHASVTTANVNDAKAARDLIPALVNKYPYPHYFSLP